MRSQPFTLNSNINISKMNTENQPLIEVKKTIERLIEAGTSFDVEELESIYHDNLQVIMIDDKGQLMNADKANFKNLFQMKRDNEEAPLNTWAEFNHIEADEQTAHVLITRKVKLTEEERKLVLSIDLVREDNRWQVTREVIFSQPIN
ncbi:nuclear transport factor 2 family protein [Aquimarina algiphila]|uniref:nuclear transport factor 2 family protein n=1 Tax=Aquimarina algiphila TaxID=2047982 RepID=UPI002330375D|nr:nuclear transport factor 2 family protein [Aquimarina algiphila]